MDIAEYLLYIWTLLLCSKYHVYFVTSLADQCILFLLFSNC